MALTVTDKLIRSADTPHTAHPVGRAGAWQVSWLPGRNLTGGKAITAMMIAQAAGRIPAGAGPQAYSADWHGRMDAWAAELGLAGPTAMVRASEPPELSRGA